MRSKRVVRAVVIAFLASGCAAGLGGMFKGADQSFTTSSLRGIHVGERMWFGLGPFDYALHQPVRITSLTLDDPAPIADLRLWDMPLATNNRRAITILEDRYFHRYGLHVEGPLIGAVYTPGPLDHYPVISLRFTRAGRYELRHFTVHYVSMDGDRGQQKISENFILGVVNGG